MEAKAKLRNNLFLGAINTILDLGEQYKNLIRKLNTTFFFENQMYQMVIEKIKRIYVY